MLGGMTTVVLAEDDTAIAEPLSRALQREGYDVDVERSFPFGRRDGQVISQDPSPGDSAEEGDTVTLKVL